MLALTFDVDDQVIAADKPRLPDMPAGAEYVPHREPSRRHRAAHFAEVAPGKVATVPLVGEDTFGYRVDGGRIEAASPEPCAVKRVVSATPMAARPSTR